MKKLWVKLSLLMGTLGLLAIAPQAQAVPAFARQMGVACNTCHFQHFPELNAFGRAFKASGFTMTGTPTIESDHFSLPSNLNAAIFTNLRYQKSFGESDQGGAHTSNSGEWVLPGETSLFVGGRVSPHVGALVEGDVGAGGLNGGGFLASIKIPMMFPVTSTINAGVVPFSAGLGPAYAFETLNTGAVGNHLINLVTTTAISAQQYVQVGPMSATDNSSEGIAAVAASSNFFVNVAKWSPNHSPVDAFSHSAAPSSDYIRAAITPTIAGWDTGFGVQWFGGQSQLVGGTNSAQTYKTSAWAIDGQMQGSVANMPLGVYVAYSQAPSSSSTGRPNLYNTGTKTKKAASIAAELGAFDDGRVTLQAAYRWGQTGNAQYNGDNAATFGVTYLPWYNVQFAVYETLYAGSAHGSAAQAANQEAPIDASGGGSSLTTVNMAVGF